MTSYAKKVVFGMTRVHLGVDVGSVSTKLVALSANGQVVEHLCIDTAGRPIHAIGQVLDMARKSLGKCEVLGVGSTGSGRVLAGAMLGADIVKNEITSHARAALSVEPEVRTILEIGGQDSKVIVLSGGVVTDFAMNTVCAAGTGSFLDRQAARLNVAVDQLGSMALQSTNPVRIAGRCAVFAESDMIHKQQIGCSTEDIINGLCEALVRNYLNNVAKGKSLKPPVLFQGGVAANLGIKRAFERALGCGVSVPEHYRVMGALGVALLASTAPAEKTRFRGFEVADSEFNSRGFECSDCPNACEIVELMMDNQVVARWGGRCGKYERTERTLSDASNAV